MRIAALTIVLALAAFPGQPDAASPPADCPKQLIEKPAIDPKTGAETAAASEARKELEMIANVTVMYQGCSMDDPTFPKKFSSQYEAWRARYRDALARYEANAHARRYVQCGLDHERRRSAADNAAGRADKAAMCHQMIGPSIERFTLHGPR